MSLEKRCPFYEEEIFEGLVIQIFCENPNLYQGDTPICPYTIEYDCDIPIHIRNMEFPRTIRE